MKRITSPFTCLLLFVALLSAGSGCCKGHIRATEIEGNIKWVTQRHDHCVNNHLEIDDWKKETFLRSSILLRDVVQEALDEAKEEEEEVN